MGALSLPLTPACLKSFTLPPPNQDRIESDALLATFCALEAATVHATLAFIHSLMNLSSQLTGTVLPEGDPPIPVSLSTRRPLASGHRLASPTVTPMKIPCCAMSLIRHTDIQLF